MKKPTELQQIKEARKIYDAVLDSAWEAFNAIHDPAQEAYAAKLEEIEAQTGVIISVTGKKYKLVEVSDE